MATKLQLRSWGPSDRMNGTRPRGRKEADMLSWALTFFLIALVAAVLGFGGVAVAAAGIARICFFIFLVLFVVSLVAHSARRI